MFEHIAGLPAHPLLVHAAAQWASRALAVVVVLAVLVSSVMTGHEGARLAWGEETSQLAEK